MKTYSFFKKSDIIIVLVLLLFAAAGLFVFRLTHSGDGRKVRVTVDSEVFGEYELSKTGAADGQESEFDAVAGAGYSINGNENREAVENTDQSVRRIEIPGKVGICVMVIDGTKVYMESADCPNQICVHHSSISHKGETIICLPNRVVIEIVD